MKILVDVIKIVLNLSLVNNLKFGMTSNNSVFVLTLLDALLDILGILKLVIAFLLIFVQ